MFGRLEKLRMLSFYDDKFLGIPASVFEAMVNPESYQMSRSIEYATDPIASARMGDAQKHKKTSSRVLSFNIILDNTGVLDTQSNVPIQVQLEAFYLTTTITVPGLHRPPYVIINWGTMVFRGVLSSSTINYTLFSSKGVPLRATLNVSFKEHIAEGVGELLAALQSPDLTKEIIVKEGDTLPLLCHQVYEDASMYLKVAKVNKMKNFRKLTPGQKLIFPPIVNNGTTTR